MIKQVIKEIGIAIMLLIAIALILSIIFYGYIPNNKTVPIAVKPYALPEDIQEELKETVKQEEENIVKTLYISSTELDVYEKKDYDKGKANPFADYTNNENNNNTTQTTNNTTNNNKNTTNTSNSTNNKVENTIQNEVYVSTSGKN